MACICVIRAKITSNLNITFDVSPFLQAKLAAMTCSQKKKHVGESYFSVRRTVVISGQTDTPVISLKFGNFHPILKESVISPLLKKCTLEKDELS